jgi:hypothetical protein
LVESVVDAPVGVTPQGSIVALQTCRDTMPYQNRVTPFSEIVVSSARGTLMGNRGCLHDGARRLTKRQWTTTTWVTCVLSFNGRPAREIMKPGVYTELFFLDEATALAAGHRPCAECRHAAYRAFKACWAAGAGVPVQGLSAAKMDRVLHADRRDGKRRQHTWRAPPGTLPVGTMVAIGGAAWLVAGEELLGWTLDGYRGRRPAHAEAEVDVLTPRSTVAALRAGYLPGLHGTAFPSPTRDRPVGYGNETD